MEFTYEDAISYINSLYNYEKDAQRISAPEFHLKSIRQLLTLLGNPQDRYATIHIAGTKGKGSTTAFLTSILISAGYTVGTYTSPHLINVLERIEIDGEPIDKKLFAKSVESISKNLGSRPKEYATFFEALTAVAFLAFREKDIDIAVVETGLGGTYDATNIIKPNIAAITRIGLDHMDRLGNTIPEIACDKAGIIKSGVTAVIGKQEKSALEKILLHCRKVNAKSIVCNRDFEFSIVDFDITGTEFELEYSGLKKKYRINCPGIFQLENASIAAVIAKILGITESAIESGLENTRIRGRFHIINKNPLVILDSAHNATSASAITKEIKLFKLEPVVFIIGINRLKDYESMLVEWAPVACKFIFTSTGSLREYDPNLLKKAGEKLGVESCVIYDQSEALEKAKTLAGENGVVFIAGSLYLAGKILSITS